MDDSPFDRLTGAGEHFIRLLGATARTHRPGVVGGEVLWRGFGRSLPRDDVGSARFAGGELRAGELGFIGILVGVR